MCNSYKKKQKKQIYASCTVSGIFTALSVEINSHLDEVLKKIHHKIQKVPCIFVQY